ncbi:regulatory signaling modulator protein AmpE [Pseudomonas citronellolis]|uniref:regulatory signaling modulator protein AmpE n=1 Tax=Pseudomonas citronellolis TaxID=53408 RepID=UPI0023E3EBC7|nr:regulatory signaling modulator protein AmpE [Pseudomonas citronellolis]MDF3937083.1 regulatory signaling modulator protein AmpE [Pseudomonas citronellolis]
MSFLVLLLALLVEKFSGWRARLQDDRPWHAWMGLAAGLPGVATRPWLALLVSLLGPLLLLALLLTLLQPLAYGLLALPVHLLVLIWSLGRGDVHQAIGPFRDAWRREDLQAAYHVAERDLGVQADSDAELFAQVQGMLVWQAFQGFFAVIFWYALLGPAAALAYRLLSLTEVHREDEPLGERAALLRHAFDWLPARALALSFALVGNFLAVARQLLHHLLAWETPAAGLLARAACAGEDLSDGSPGAVGVASLDSLWQLLVRAALLWYALFALGALFL